MKHQILFRHVGENFSTAKQPCGKVLSIAGTIATLDEGGTVDLTTKTDVCLAFDDDRLVQTDLYAVNEVEIPDWLTVPEWISHGTEFKWFVGFGGNLDWGREWFFKFSRFGEAQKLGAIKLLNTKKFRSLFRQSLRTQLEAWLNEPEPKHPSPFSPRQWEVILDGHTCRQAKRLSENLYYTNR